MWFIDKNKFYPDIVSDWRIDKSEYDSVELGQRLPSNKEGLEIIKRYLSYGYRVDLCRGRSAEHCLICVRRTPEICEAPILPNDVE